MILVILVDMNVNPYLSYAQEEVHLIKLVNLKIFLKKHGHKLCSHKAYLNQNNGSIKNIK